MVDRVAAAFLLADLGITQSYSRPHVSNDNPLKCERTFVRDAVPGMKTAASYRQLTLFADKQWRSNYAAGLPSASPLALKFVGLTAHIVATNLPLV